MSLRERAELADGLGGEQAPVAGFPSAVVVVDLQPAVLEQPPQDVFGVFEHDVADWELVQQRRVGVDPASWASCCWASSAWCCSARSSAMQSWMLSRKARLRVFAGFEAVDEPALPRGQVGDLVAQLNRGVLTRAPTQELFTTRR